MKLLGPDKPKEDTTGESVAGARLTRKQRLVKQLEIIRAIHPERDEPKAPLVVEALVAYIDDKYITHLIDRIELTKE
jgi:hypothetical protein